MAFPFISGAPTARSSRGDNEENRFGSSRFATYDDLVRAGLFEQRPESFFVGFFEDRPVYFHGPAGLSLVAGARAGKMRDVICRNLLTGTCLQSVVMLDPKAEGAYLSQDQTADGKFCAYWNPVGLHGLPQDRINPVDYLRLDSLTLIPDAKVLLSELFPDNPNSKDDYFKPRAREYAEALVLAVAEITGEVTFPALYEAVGHLIAGGEPWLDIAYQMSKSRFPNVRQKEVEIATSRSDTTGGFRGILGELSKAFACLSDPTLMASVSPPYTMSLADLVSGDQAWQLFLCAPAEYIRAWSMVLKSFFTGAMLYKSRAPGARRITFLLDECGQLGGEGTSGFPLVPRLFTYGAGIGVQPIAVFQTEAQMDNLGANARSLIQSSAAGKLMFGIRDLDSAKSCADMCGSQTLIYDDQLAQARAQHAKANALQSIIQGGDPMQAALTVAHQDFEAEHRTKQHRQLQMPEEVLNSPTDEAYFFHEGVPYPIKLKRKPYWDHWPPLNYHPNPYHPPLDRVQVRTRWGRRWHKVITEPVPERFAHYPQYRGGTWSRLDR